MAYDEELAQRIRAVIGDEPTLMTKNMFGGFAFLVGGSMAVAAGRNGALMVRCDPDESDALVAEPGVERMVMKGRPMRAWLLVDADVVDGADALRRWVEVGLSTARTIAAS